MPRKLQVKLKGCGARSNMPSDKSSILSPIRKILWSRKGQSLKSTTKNTTRRWKNSCARSEGLLSAHQINQGDAVAHDVHWQNAIPSFRKFQLHQVLVFF